MAWEKTSQRTNFPREKSGPARQHWVARGSLSRGREGAKLTQSTDPRPREGPADMEDPSSHNMEGGEPPRRQLTAEVYGHPAVGHAARLVRALRAAMCAFWPFLNRVCVDVHRCFSCVRR